MVLKDSIAVLIAASTRAAPQRAARAHQRAAKHKRKPRPQRLCGVARGVSTPRLDPPGDEVAMAKRPDLQHPMTAPEGASDALIFRNSADPGVPEARGLYDPALDKDSCGVGFIADIKGRK